MTTGQIKQAEVDPIAEAPVAGASRQALPRWIWLCLAAGVLVLGFVVYTGIHARATAESNLVQATDESSLPTVAVVHPTPSGSAAQEIVLPGNVTAFIDTPIYARTSGYLKAWYFDIGARVKQGQLLATISSPEVDQQLLQARADVVTAQTTAGLAQTNATRYQGLILQNAVTQEATDNFVSQAQATSSAVKAAQANVRRLEELQAFEKIYAPFDGVVTARNTDIGSLVAAGENTAPQELFHLAAIHKLRVYVSVPEADSQSVRTGAVETLTFDEFPGQLFHGVIVRNANAIDPASRTLNVEIDVDNPQGQIMPGAYAFVHLKLVQKGESPAESLIIPADTLLFRAEGLRVGVVRNGAAQVIPVTIGRDYGSNVEIVQGLLPSDNVILNPPDSLVSGTPVHMAASNP
jgi:RND family efflux transporter MFP subunit